MSLYLDRKLIGPMKPVEAVLRQFDRHCDEKGLDTTERLALGKAVISGEVEITVDVSLPVLVAENIAKEVERAGSVEALKQVLKVK